MVTIGIPSRRDFPRRDGANFSKIEIIDASNISIPRHRSFLVFPNCD